jgi:hypothetical protein
MEETLLSYLLDKVGPATLLLMAFAVIWDRQKQHGARLDSIEEKIWEIHGE